MRNSSNINHASAQWSSAGISHYGVNHKFDADIQVIGGKLETIEDLVYGFSALDAGYTSIPNRTYLGYWEVGSFNLKRDMYRINSGTKVYFRTDTPTYEPVHFRKVMTHEFGHAFGWFGDMQTIYTGQIMSQGKSTVNQLGNHDKNHLLQVY